ncbi:hypothetical protein ETB97_005132 [Aspergillus alliaceus]|uniref:Uncharacterized protein n=1 Tax=Petromyces alliaceus TaxID=209559 RepID=A0A8H6E3E1_PETAA|nr:hypothetical protein ETB97_005132 [Aspergillus burnettii]
MSIYRATLLILSSTLNLLHIYRTHVSTHIGPLVDIDPSLTYNTLQRPPIPDKDDLILLIPAPRVKDKTLQALAQLIRENVTGTYPIHASTLLNTHIVTLPLRSPKSPLIEKSLIGGPYVQLYFQTDSLAHIALQSILENGDSYGSDYRLSPGPG